MKTQPLRTTVIGSHPFPGWLEFASGHLPQFGEADRAEMIDDAVTIAVRDQLDAGLDVIGHVHDEILVEGAHSVETVSEIMTAAPTWAAGMPIDGAGYTTKRYKK